MKHGLVAQSQALRSRNKNRNLLATALIAAASAVAFGAASAAPPEHAHTAAKKLLTPRTKPKAARTGDAGDRGRTVTEKVRAKAAPRPAGDASASAPTAPTPWWDATIATVAGTVIPASPATAFASFIADLWPAAQARGVSRGIFDAALKGVTFDQSIERLTHGNQPEFVKPIWDYLEGVVSRADVGREKAQALKKTLDRVEADFEVPREIVVAIWGIESSFGAGAGKLSTVRVLATLAFARYRDGMFRDELLDALQILQSGDVSNRKMVGSWAGAMGQTQFMPSSYLKYAVDYNAKGRRDIWNDAVDALASTANFLRSSGWDPKLPWGFEVVLPAGFDASHYEQTTSASFIRWAERGVRRRAGTEMPTAGDAVLLIPAGMQGPAFLVTPNFKVIKAYNNSTAYALAVALLGERIAGRPAVGAPWPVAQKVLNVSQTIEVQKRLKALGFDVGNADGIVGERVRDAVLAYEAKRGGRLRGVVDQTLLEGMRAAH